MKKMVSVFAVVPCAGVSFSLVAGQVCEVPADVEADLIASGYAVANKKGLTLDAAREIVAKAAADAEAKAAADAEAKAAADAEAKAAADAEAKAAADAEAKA